MLRLACVLSALVLGACHTPPSYVKTAVPPAPMLLAIAPVDTPAVRQLCVAPDSVVAARKPCVLRGR